MSVDEDVGSQGEGVPTAEEMPAQMTFPEGGLTAWLTIAGG